MARILLVHHDLTQIMLFKNVLTREGYAFLSASNYATALEIVQHTPVQLVFFSAWLSSISGIDLAHSLRTLDPTLPLVVLMSVFDTHRSRLDALNVRTMLRPFEPSKIVRTTERYLRHDVDA